MVVFPIKMNIHHNTGSLSPFSNILQSPLPTHTYPYNQSFFILFYFFFVLRCTTAKPLRGPRMIPSEIRTSDCKVALNESVYVFSITFHVAWAVNDRCHVHSCGFCKYHPAGIVWVNIVCERLQLHQRRVPHVAGSSVVFFFYLYRSIFDYHLVWCQTRTGRCGMAAYF